MGKQEKLFPSDKEKARLNEILNKNSCALAENMRAISESVKYFKVFSDYTKIISDDTELLRDNLRAGVESGLRLLKSLRVAADAAGEVIDTKALLASLAAGVVVTVVPGNGGIELRAAADDTDDEDLAAEPLGLPSLDQDNEPYDIEDTI